jgi:carboxylate-amine ligase
VRPHPNLGTVEIRAMDAQTRVEHTLGLAALIQAMCKELAEHYESGGELAPVNAEMLDENRWIAARHGLAGTLVDLPSREKVTAGDLARRLYDRLRGHAEDLGGAAELEGILDLIERGNGAQRQRLVYHANRDYAEVMREIVGVTAPEPDRGGPARPAA